MIDNIEDTFFNLFKENLVKNSGNDNIFDIVIGSEAYVLQYYVGTMVWRRTMIKTLFEIGAKRMVRCYKRLDWKASDFFDGKVYEELVRRHEKDRFV